MSDEESECRDEWIKNARLSFVPSQKKACEVCGQYESLCQAHHVIPLSIQWDRNYFDVDHSHVWLCPTHHAAVHSLLRQSYSGRELATRHIARVILDVCAVDGREGLRKLLKIIGKE